MLRDERFDIRPLTPSVCLERAEILGDDASRFGIGMSRDVAAIRLTVFRRHHLPGVIKDSGVVTAADEHAKIGGCEVQPAMSESANARSRTRAFG